MSFCGNVLELVEKHSVLDDTTEFIQWSEDEDVKNYPDIEVFVEKNILPELQKQEQILIDALLWESPAGDKMGILFAKNDKDTYGSSI